MSDDNIENPTAAIELSPYRINSLWETGKYALELENYGAAIRAFEKALTVDPSLPGQRLLSDAYFSRGERQLDDGRWEQAIDDFDKSLVGDSTDFRVYLYRGRANLLGNRPQEALTDFNNSLVAYPPSPDARALIAAAYRALGDRDKARASLEVALSLDPALRESPWIKDLIQTEMPGYVVPDRVIEESPYLARGTHVLQTRRARTALDNLAVQDTSEEEVSKAERPQEIVPDPLKENGKSALKRIGEEVAAARGQRSQRWLADLVGTTEASIRRLERGETNASVILFARTAQVLGLDVNELLAPIESEESLVKRHFGEHKSYIEERTSAMELNTETFSVKRELLRLLELWPK